MRPVPSRGTAPPANLIKLSARRSGDFSSVGLTNDYTVAITAV